jgi:hypothetical protein
MLLRLTKPLLSTCTVLSLCAVLAAQGRGEQGEEGERPVRQTKPTEAIEMAIEGSDGKESGGKEGKEEWERLTPEERLERSIRSGASSFCRFVASVRPARLMPGQSGTLYVTAVLQGSAVIPSPAPLTVTSPTTQGLVTLGSASFQEAKVGRIAQAYLGRPVYDNYAILEVPITMSADAKLGQKQAVHVDMKFDLYDGNSAQVLGRFLDRATTEIEVGLAADPNVVASAKAPVAAAGNQAAGGAVAKPGEDAALGGAKGGNALGGEAVIPTAVPDPVPALPPVTDAPPAPEVSEIPLLPLALGGGGLLMLIGLLVLRKK